jgi:hypothetical protein
VTAWRAAGLYLAVSLLVTWPLARGLASDVPWDLGDSLLNLWILSWDCEQLLAILGGDVSRIPRFFDGNIFYPAPQTLAYSEHLIPQALQVLPVYAATKNPILAYNLLFLSTFVLSGVGAFLLVRELTGNWRAALLGGLLFAFAPYRIPQHGHLQVLSSQWMPFALYGFTRYLNHVAAGSAVPMAPRYQALAGAAASLLLVSLSCNYYLMYFVPFAAAYVLWEMVRRGLWRERRPWLELAVAAVITLALLAPFLLPYIAVRDAFEMTRRVEEVSRFSADVYSYWTAVEVQNIWGAVMTAWPKNEGELFAGATPLLLGALAILLWLADAWRAGADANAGRRPLRLVLSGLLALTLVLLIAAIYERRLILDIGPINLRVTSLGRVLLFAGLLVAALAAASARGRARFRALASVQGFFCVAIVAAWWLSLGPQPRAMGLPLDLPSPYRLLYDLVPGFDGVRVPARYAMVLALMLAVAGAVAAARFLKGRAGTAALAVICVLFLVEAHASPFMINSQGGAREFVLPEARVYPPASAPAVYRSVARLPAEAVLLELPIGDPDWDLQAVYYSATHWRRIVNGYSGFFPPNYGLLALALNNPSRDAALSTATLRGSGATHVLVHERAYRDGRDREITEWLTSEGARLVTREGQNALYALR